MRILLALIVAATLSACDRWDAKAPQPTQAGQSDVAVPVSFAQAEISVSSQEFRDALMAKYGAKPLSEGVTGDISAKLLVEEKTVEQRIVNQIVTPYKAAGCAVKQVAAQCPQNTVKRIKERCFKNLRPWDCFKTVTETIYVPCQQEIRECWPEVKEVIESKIEPFISIKENIIPTSIRVHHTVRLLDAGVQAIDQGVSVTATFKIGISVDVKQGLLNASMTVKGALACDSQIKVSARSSALVTAQPAIDLEIKDFNIDAQKICVPGAVEVANAALSNPGTYLTKELVGPILKKVLLDAINKQMQQAIGDDLNFKDDLARLQNDIRDPIKLGDDIWLTIAPARLWLSQFKAAGSGPANKLMLNVAVEAALQVVGGEKPAPAPQAAALPIGLKSDIANSFAAAVHGKVSLEDAKARLSEAVPRLFNEKFPDAPLFPGPVSLYQSGAKFVIGVPFLKRSDKKEIGTAYLWATPYIEDSTYSVRLKDVAFDIDSHRMLVKVADWLLSSTIEKFIEHAARFEYGGLVARLENGMGFRPKDVPRDNPMLIPAIAVFSPDPGKFESDGKTLAVSGHIHRIDFRNIWIADNAINLLGIATGDLNLRFKPHL
jgi:hypothetical protein